MNALILEKTEKGRDEITTRAHHLPMRLRSLLLLVDGKTHSEELLRKVSGLGLDEQSLDELTAGGFIHPRDSMEKSGATEPVSRREAALSRHANAGSSAPDMPAPNPIAVDEAAKGADVKRLLAIQQFYNGTIREMIGLKGFGLQLKVERAACLDDYIALRQPYIDAIKKSKGKEAANAVAAQLDRLLSGEPAAND